MFKRSFVYQAMLCALLLPVAAQAEIEASGYIKNETAVFTRSGQITGNAGSMLDRSGHDSGDLLKFENSVRLFLNAEIGGESSVHGELNIIYDSEGVNHDYKGHRIYTQNDWLRELYLDTLLGGWDIRLGKQQLVWGTADGIKLLDIINPSDFRELVQNTMEDSRIPIWMGKVEHDVGERGNIQLVVSQVEENKIPGLNSDGDSGHPFIMKGVDTITGDVHGFLNVAPALARVASSFTTGATMGLIGGAPSPLGLVPTAGITVDGFASPILEFHDFDGTPDTNQADNFIVLPFDPRYGTNDPALEFSAPGAIPLGQITQGGLAPGDPNGNGFVTNLMPVGSDLMFFSDQTYSSARPTSAFEYMSNATFATFNTFAGASSSYVRDYPSDSNVNAGLRYKGSLDNGLNFSLNYFYHYSANPDVNLSWHDAATGEELTVQRAPAGDFLNNNTGAEIPDGSLDLADFTQSLSRNQVPTDLTTGLPTTILLHNGAGEFYGAFNPTAGARGFSGNPVDLRFTESLHRVHSIGASFDYALDTGFAPIILRGEFLYDRNDKQPVIDKRLLAIGDLTNSLRMEDADFFKYVIGVDVTVLTNLLVSGQFIQFRNLDYVDEKISCVTQTDERFDCSRYTGHLPTLHLTNGLNQDEENKEFYSLFLSKPFGPSDEHRWNNIVIYEENDGWWNRLDVEYSFTDELIGTAEWNHYWGDEDTQFGQFHDSSSFQIGIRYIFE